jgi:hypothetical protein
VIRTSRRLVPTILAVLIAGILAMLLAGLAVGVADRSIAPGSLFGSTLTRDLDARAAPAVGRAPSTQAPVQTA